MDDRPAAEPDARRSSRSTARCAAAVSVPCRPGAHQRGVRLRQRRRRPDVRGRGARPQRTSRASPSSARAGELLDKLLAEIELRARGRVHRECAEVEAAGQPRSRARGDRGLQALSAERQIELIEPLVICTLGNFSTKLLTRRQDGITRVHGKPQEHTISGLRTDDLPDLPPRRGPAQHPDAQRAARGLRPAAGAAGGSARAAGAEEDPGAEETRRPPVPATQLGLFG